MFREDRPFSMKSVIDGEDLMRRMVLTGSEDKVLFVILKNRMFAVETYYFTV